MYYFSNDSLNSEYKDVNDVESIILSNNVDEVIIGGDFNTCFDWRNVQTRCLKEFIERNCLKVTWESSAAVKDYTYTNLGLNHVSCIDHFIVT